MNRFNLRSRKLALVAAKAVYSVAWRTCRLRAAAPQKKTARTRTNVGNISLFQWPPTCRQRFVAPHVQSCAANIGEAQFTIRQNSVSQTDFLHRGGRTRVHSLRPNKLQVVVLTFKNLPSDGQQQGHRSEQPIENFIHVDSAVVTSTPGRGVNWQLLNPSYTFL